MISGTANATTDYAEVTAKATIEVAGTISCSDMNFGTIVVKQNNAETTISYGDGLEYTHYDKTSILSVTNVSNSLCSTLSTEDTGVDYPDSIELKADGKSTKLIYYPLMDIEDAPMFYGDLEIPAQVQAGEYTGSFTVTHTY
ncbi:MAG: hypothetical protein IJ019_06955 [Alphaproteobacteria bacterium]|nr:hypothetical protein [Alphaproteobacteria bacterium]